MKSEIALALLMSLASCAGPATAPPPAPEHAAPVLRDGDEPIGELGFSLGTCLTIEGRPDHRPSMNPGNTLSVDTVNGKKLDSPVSIVINNVYLLPRDMRCVLKGYEIGAMDGQPPAIEDAAHELGKAAPLVQHIWSWDRWFMVTSAVTPSDLKLNPDPLAEIRSRPADDGQAPAAR